MIDLLEAISPTSHQQLTPDVRVESHGTIYLVFPLSGRAARWIDEYVSVELQWFGRSLLVEHRYARDLIELMCQASLLVKVQPFTLPSGDQDASERVRSALLPLLERHLVVKVRLRTVAYGEIAHFRSGTIEFRVCGLPKPQRWAAGKSLRCC